MANVRGTHQLSPSCEFQKIGFVIGRKKWLVCVDGSEGGQRAFMSTLFDLAQPQRKDIIYVLTVKRGKEDANELVERYESQFQGHHTLLDAGLEYEILVKEAPKQAKTIGETICNLVEELGVHYVVVGSRGLSGLKKVLLPQFGLCGDVQLGLKTFAVKIPN